MAAQKKQLSLDANIAFDLSEDKDSALDFPEFLQRKGYALVLPPTAVHELHVILADGDSLAERELAQTALTHLLRWGIRPFDLDATEEAICEQFVRGLLRQRLLPDDALNDGLILAETSLAKIPMLVTADKHLLNIDEDALLLAFNEANLAPVHPLHPKRLLGLLC